MRAVVTRVSEASVVIEGETVAKIRRGLLVLVGIAGDDTTADIDYIVGKVMNLRVFEDGCDKMNLSLDDVKGGLIVVSNFTVMGNCIKGRRPSFTGAGSPADAKLLYENLEECFKRAKGDTGFGRFGADMQVHSTNDGPVTLLLDSRKIF